MYFLANQGVITVIFMLPFLLSIFLVLSSPEYDEHKRVVKFNLKRIAVALGLTFVHVFVLTYFESNFGFCDAPYVVTVKDDITVMLEDCRTRNNLYDDFGPAHTRKAQ